MKTIWISATDARNNFFNLLNQVIYEGVRVIVEKAGANMDVVLMPRAKEIKEHERVKKALKQTFGVLPDFPNVTRFRHSRRNPLSL